MPALGPNLLTRSPSCPSTKRPPRLGAAISSTAPGNGARKLGGGVIDATERGNGDVIGKIGRASEKDVAEVAVIPVEYQTAWAAPPGPHFGDIVREASRP